MKKYLLFLITFVLVVIIFGCGFLVGADNFSKGFVSWGNYRQGYFDALSKNLSYTDGYNNGFRNGMSTMKNNYTPASLIINTQPVESISNHDQTVIVIKHDDKPLISFNETASGIISNVHIFSIELNANDRVDFYPIIDDLGNTYFEVKSIKAEEN